MTTRTWPDHLLTLAEWDALPEDASRRIELVEGALQVSPRPAARHQLLTAGLAVALDAALRPRWRALAEVELTVDATDPPTVRTPDVTVVRGYAADGRSRQVVADVLAVVEVLSPGSRRTDRVLKSAEYAEVGIEHYLLVDPGPPPRMVEYRLDGAAYRRVGDHGGRAALALGGVEVAPDLDAML